MIGEKRKRESKDSKPDPIDSTLIDEFGDRLLLVSQDDKKHEITANVDNLVTFSNKHSLQLLQAWSFYSQANNHGKLISITGKLGWFLSICNQHLQALSKNGAIVIREIIEHHLKIIYRCLFSSRSNITNPALRILKEIVEYNNGSFTGDLFSSMDLTLKAFPKILSIVSEERSSSGTIHNSMRTSFLQFYLSFIKNGSPIIRKDLIVQKKVIAGWFKRLNQDPDDLVLTTLKTFTENILQENAFTKSTKISFFNDWVVNNMVKLFSRSDEIVEQVLKFFTLLATDSTHGIKFPENGWYPSTVKRRGGDDGSAPEESSIHNRLLLSLLKVLKPWEDLPQQELAIAILKSSPELVSPYVTIGLDSISFNPRLSSFWISYANFLSKVIQLPVPHLQSLQPPPASVVIESILPSAVYKSSSLTKCLNHEVLLIRHLACQIIVLSLRKTLLVVKEYSKRGWDSSDITFAVNDRLPLLQTIVSSLKSQNEPLFNTVVTMALSLYGSVFPESTSNFSLPSSLTTNWQEVIDDSAIDGLKLIQVRESLQLQMSSDAIGKWYNKSQDSNYSIFTRLLQLSVSNNSFADQVYQLLKGLTNPTLLFQDETLVSPVEVLIQSLSNSMEEMSSEDKEKIWKLIDESVARCMRSPYKYVDEFASLRTNETDVMSPFIVTMLEQWKYVKSPSKFVEKWLCRFIRDCCVCGESWSVAFKLVEKAGLNRYIALVEEAKFLEWKDILELDEFFDFVLSNDSSAIIDRSDLHFKILGVYELQAIKFRVLHDSENRKLVSHLFSSIPLFLASSLSTQAFLKDLLLSEEIANDYFSALKSFISQDSELDVSQIKSYVSKNFSTDGKLQSAVWLLDSADISNILQTIPFDPSLFRTCIDRLTELKEPLDIKLLKTLMKEAIDSNLAESLAASFEINPPKVSEDFDEWLQFLFNNNSIRIMCSIIRSTHHLPGFIKESVIPDESLIEIASTVSQVKDDDLLYKDLFVRASTFALDSIKKERHILPSLDLLSRTLDTLSKYQLDEISDFFNKITGSISLSSPIVNLAASFYKYNPDGLKIWLQKCVVWLTKQFSENSEISPVLKGFLVSFGK